MNRGMLRLLCCSPAVAVLALVLTSCGGASSPQQGGGAPPVEAIIIAPGEMRGGSDAVWRVNINGYNGPFRISWDFGGGAVTNDHSFSDELSPNLLRVRMVNPGPGEEQYTATVTVRDKVGATDTATYSYRVGPPGADPPPLPPPGNRPPVIEEVTVSEGMLSVLVSDPDGDTVTVSVTDEFGNDVGEDQGTELLFALDRWFGFWLQREIGLVISASDGAEAVTKQSAYTPQPVDIAEDTLYAVATADTAPAVRDPQNAGPGKGVRVIVFTGPTKWPFQRLAGVAVTCEDGSDYVQGSFDAGIPDDESDTDGITGIDGIWELLDADELEVTPDDQIGGPNRRDLPGSRGALDFRIIPQGALELEGAEGVLFSFVMAFSQPGEYRIGFQPTDTISRTYYQDQAQLNEYFWGDISNEGVPNTVTVN